MICEECNDNKYNRDICKSECQVCGVDIKSPHFPPYQLCKKCSVKYDMCQQCGKKIDNIDDENDSGSNVKTTNWFD